MFLRLHAFVFSWRHMWTEELIAILLVLFVFIAPASAAMRLQDRSLYINNSEPSATTSYTVSFRYMSPQSISSVEMLVCNDPIPYHACVKPAGFDASNAVLAEQTGETGFSILSKSSNRLVLTRPASPLTPGAASYKFDNIVNPSNIDKSFSIRLKTHASLNATGPQVDFGSVMAQASKGVVIRTQVPPMLIFCVAEEVTENCTQTNETYYTDMGQLSSQSTLRAQSQMAVGTNASGGFAITANGVPPSAGTNVIPGSEELSVSRQGTNQFAINLVENSELTVGKDPEGDWANAVPASDYSVPNRFKYVPGDVVAYSPNVSLMKKFTVSYIMNSSEDLRAGVYSTTITYIASGRF